MNIIKEFIAFKRMLNSYQKIDLEESDKIRLEAFDKDTIRKVCNKVGENLAREILQDNVSREYALGYKHAMAHLLSYFKTNIKENGK